MSSRRQQNKKAEKTEEIEMLHLVNSIVLGLGIVVDVIAANGLQILF